MGYAKLLKIVKTYRNSQEVIDIAGNFIQKNVQQITKRLESPKKISEPVIIYTYDSTFKKAGANRRSGVNYATAHAVEVALEQIIIYSRQENRRVESILLLGRFNFDGDQLEKSGLFEYISRGSKIKSVKYPKLNITFMTAHSSKGLGYDEVIIVNGKNETYGFPSKIEDDPVLAFVIKGDRSIDYAEERRLFYVAMTRTKNRVYFIAPEQNPSEFLLELKRDYKNVVIHGNWNEAEPENLNRKSCPLCGYPLQFKYKNAYGLRLHICTNEPEVCGFITNEYRAGKLSILKCDYCRDGYLIVKPAKSDFYFLGCTNYKNDGTGCKKSISKKQFYDMMNYMPDPAHPAKVTARPDKKKKEEDIQSDQPKSKVISVNIEKRDDIIIEKGNFEPVLYNGQDLNDLVYVILNALQNVSNYRYYGFTMLLDVLSGTTTKRLLAAKLNNVPEFGKLETIPRNDLYAMVDWLIKNNFILRTKGQYPVLHLTYSGMHYKEEMTLNQLKRLKKYLELWTGIN